MTAGGSDLLPVRAAGFRGMVAAVAADGVASCALPDPSAHVRDGTVLRGNRYRVTGCVEWPGVGRVLLKAHRTRKLGEALSSVVRPSRATAEWRTSRYLAAAGLPVAEPLAVAEKRRRGMVTEAFFAARFLDGLATFRESLRQADAAAARRLLVRAARLFRVMHDRGYDHRDLHAGNVLAGPAGEKRSRLVLIDLHRGRRGSAVSERARTQALGRWLHSLVGDIGPGGRLRTVKAYLGEAASDRSRLRRHMGAVTAHAARLERVRRRSRAKRCWMESSVYTRDVGSDHGARRRDLPTARIDAALCAHDDALAANDERVAKVGRRSRVTRHGDLVVKEAVSVGLLGRIRARLAPWRHRAGYRNAHLLDVLGVATARPLACLRRSGRTFTLYEDLSDLVRLDHLARRLYRAGDVRACRRLRDDTADWLSGLHRRGIYHGDLKAVNVLVRDGARFAFPLIDTDRVRFFDRGVDERRRVKNLAQLAASLPVVVSRTERLRWFRRYAAGSPLEDRERETAQAVAAHLARKIVVVDEPIE